MKFIALALAATAALVSAQEPTVHVVQVGLNAEGAPGPVFTPSAIKAKVGDQVAFQFRAKNHTVTQSSFAEPCTRQFNTATQQLGVDSEFQPVAPDATEIPVWTIQVENDSAPLWFFCNFGPHCNAGMVFSINAQDEGQGERTHAAFLAKAATANHPPPEASVSADFTPPTPTGAPSGNNSAPGPAPTGELSTTTLSNGENGGENGENGGAPPTGSNTAPSANETTPEAAGSPAFAVKVSGAGIAASLVALVALAL